MSLFVFEELSPISDMNKYAQYKKYHLFSLITSSCFYMYSSIGEELNEEGGSHLH